MLEPPLAPDEPLRLAALRATKLIDSPIEERFERITRLAARVLGTPIAAISLVDAERQFFASIQGLDVTGTSRAVSFCGHTILCEDAMVVPDARADERFADNPLVTGSPHVVFYAGCPIRSADGSKIGAICVIDRQARSMSAEDAQLLRDLAAVVEGELLRSALAASQQELLEQVDAVSRRAQVDGLTRLWNRGAVLARLEERMIRSRRGDKAVAVVMIDLDHFKQINDTYGHATGDEVLRQAARRMLGAVRDTDVVGRFGGEEFLAALGECDDLGRAVSIAERIRLRLAESPFTVGHEQLPVTASAGVAFARSAREITAERLLEAADRALYLAKTRGRNRVESVDVEGEPQRRAA